MPNREYMKGYIAGLLDGEGSVDISGIRIVNTNIQIMKRLKKYLENLNIKFRFDQKKQIGPLSKVPYIYQITIARKSEVNKFYFEIYDCAKREKLLSFVNGSIRRNLRECAKKYQIERYKKFGYIKYNELCKNPMYRIKINTRDRQKRQVKRDITFAMKNWFGDIKW